MRGVDVRLLVPAKTDVPLVGPAARSTFPRLEYLPSMLHEKTMVVDGQWSVVGSANVDIRSFRYNFEVGAVLKDEAGAAELEKRFLAELEDSRELTWSRASRLPIGTRVLQSPGGKPGAAVLQGALEAIQHC